ncbi:MAG TPA: PilW family protein [Gammaproteobacteria bacterium]
MHARLHRALRAFGLRRTGLTLVELMVALAVGTLLMLGAAELFVQGLRAFRVTESVARLHENARFALDVLESDVQMAGYFGLAAHAGVIAGRAGPDAPPGPGPAACGNNWAVDLDRPVEAANGYRWACAASYGVAPWADTLVVRRAEPEPVVPAAGALHVQSVRFGESALFAGAALPAGFDAASSQTHTLSVNGYYVSPRSTLDAPGNPVPSLRRKTLRTGPAIVDEEVLPGVEDLQVELGVDTDSEDEAGGGAVDRYVQAGDPLLDSRHPDFVPEARVLTVRIWLRARAERPETGFTDTARYVYADQDVGPLNDGFRRVVVSRTVQLRNARGPR